MSEPAIQIEALSVTYGSGPTAVLALDQVSLTVRRGEMLALMGPSGSGKTTLLMVMGCLLRPSAGRAALLGRELGAMSQAQMAAARLAGVGFVFQSYNLFPALTALETVAMTLQLKGWTAALAQAEALRLLGLLGLSDRLHNRPGQLSGGQKQRVAIARALAGNPAVLLADEPTAALDSKTGRAIVDTLHGLARQDGRAVVVVTHDPRVGEIADRIVTIEDGRITQPVEELPA
jgi:putative ABC transport system ATP-binding protein